ncbi:MAG: hypothetical protein GF331_17060 [Chitinivibrionales bacterium]|nr:hypothetical protein [Chitinivibrionales bacterium]
MNTQYYPDKTTVDRAIAADDPLLVLISHDGASLLVANIDDSFEHVVLLKQLGLPETDIDRYFRLIVNRSTADWTFVCPFDYRGITDRDRRIETYFNDGIARIAPELHRLGYDVPVNIPRRYRRHFRRLGGE